MMNIHMKVCIGATLLVAVFAGSVSAGMIVDTPAPIASGPGLGFVAVPAIATPNPNNDNQTGGGLFDNNIVVPLKRFDSNQHIDIVFTVEDTAGVTEYVVSEFVDNNTGVDWIGYRMLLGFGTGAGFTQVAGDGLDFDAPTFDPPPTSSAMPVVVAPDEDTLIYSGGLHTGGAQLYRFRIDVPDLGNRLPPDVGTFTLRQIPIPIPEPSALALAGISALGLAWRRRRS